MLLFVLSAIVLGDAPELAKTPEFIAFQKLLNAKKTFSVSFVRRRFGAELKGEDRPDYTEVAISLPDKIRVRTFRIGVTWNGHEGIWFDNAARTYHPLAQLPPQEDLSALGIPLPKAPRPLAFKNQEVFQMTRSLPGGGKWVGWRFDSYHIDAGGSGEWWFDKKTKCLTAASFQSLGPMAPEEIIQYSNISFKFSVLPRDAFDVTPPLGYKRLAE